jgi:hypothetical protein
MSDYDDLMHNYQTAAAQDLPPLIEKAATALGITDDEQRGILGSALLEAWMDGAHAGQAEVVAQAVEQGLDPEHLIVNPPDEQPPSS